MNLIAYWIILVYEIRNILGEMSIKEVERALSEFKPTDKSQLLTAFRKVDVNGDGFISHTELYRVLTTVSFCFLMLFVCPYLKPLVLR